MEVWSTGRLNVGSKGMNRESDGPAIAVKPFAAGDNTVGEFADELTEALAKYLDTKDWIDSLIQKNPSEEDYQLTGNVMPSGGNFEVNIILKAPGGKNLWSGHTGGSMRQISLLGDTVGEQVSNQVFLEIAKVRDKYK